MYSRDFGGIQSEGQLYNLQREYADNYRHPPSAEDDADCPPDKPKGFSLGFLRDLKLDDLILIGIGILLLLDSDAENDIFILLIAFILLF